VSTPPGRHPTVMTQLILEDTNVKDMIKTFIDDEGGLTIVEYAVAGSLIAVGVILAFTSLGTKIGQVISGIDGKLVAPT
jgi:pilus assembly protein Flp/PilA